MDLAVRLWKVQVEAPADGVQVSSACLVGRQARAAQLVAGSAPDGAHRRTRSAHGRVGVHSLDHGKSLRRNVLGI